MNHRLRKYLMLCLVIFSAAANCSAASGKDDTLSIQSFDRFINSQLPYVAPGGVVCITKHGKIIYQKAFGKASLRTGQMMGLDMTFRIGSLTKQFTAVAILHLAEQGKLSLTDSIQKYVKEFPVKPYRITIENLLTQTSGIINYQAIEHPDAAKVRENYTPAQGIDYFKDEPLLFKPGTKFDYSNSNYYLLGYIIEQVTEKSYQKYLKEELLEPIGLLYTDYIDTRQRSHNMASGYSRYKNKWEIAELQNETTLYAAGGLVSNVTDLLKWHRALVEGRLISKSLLKKAFASYRLEGGTLSEYGYGCYTRNLDGEPTVEHSGSTDGYQTNEIYLPNQDIFIVTLFNGFEQDMDWIVLSNDIARMALGKTIGKDIKLDEVLLKQYAGTYLFNSEHQLIVTYKNHQLFVEAVNPKDRLPRVQLHAKSSNRFYIKEAGLEFEFATNEGGLIQLTTYNALLKDAEWKKLIKD